MGNVLSPEELEAMRAMAGEDALPAGATSTARPSSEPASVPRMTNYRAALPSLPAPDFAKNGRAPEGWCERHEEIHSCCICRDGGWIPEPPDRADDGRPVRRQAGDLTTGYLHVLVLCWCRWDSRPPFDPKRHRFPMRLEGATLESWPGARNSRPRIAAANYVLRWPPEKPWLTFLGGTGRGKTGLACGIVREVWERHGVAGQVWTMEEILSRYKATFDEDSRRETTEAVTEHLLTLPLLVVDDLGAEKLTDWTDERTFALINGRYSGMKPTIVTGNQESPGFAGLQGRVKSRLMDASIGEWMVVEGPDRRLGGVA